MDRVSVRNYTQADGDQTGELYKAVTSEANNVFWRVGGEGNWPNVFLALEDGRVIGKGQVALITAVEPGSPLEHRHYIYFNLKTRPEQERDYPLYDRLWEPLLGRAVEIKKSLAAEYKTMLAVGNLSTEAANNAYFIGKGFAYRKSLFSMRRDLTLPISTPALEASYRCIASDLSSEASIEEYLAADREIWPHAPIGIGRLQRNQAQPGWTLLAVRDSHEHFLGSVMCWIEPNGEGSIEDVFVREPWRNRGIAKHLLAQALSYLQSSGCPAAELQVETANASALSLYRSAGFHVVSEEVRFEKEL